MKLIDTPISKVEVQKLAKAKFATFIKAVVDIEKGVMVIDASMHADEEAFLLSSGSEQRNLWGVNLYLELSREDFIEFDSMINLRPHEGNMTRSVDDPSIQKQIRKIIDRLIT